MVDAWGGWSLFQEMLRTLKKISLKHDVSIPAVAVKYVLNQVVEFEIYFTLDLILPYYLLLVEQFISDFIQWELRSYYRSYWTSYITYLSGYDAFIFFKDNLTKKPPAFSLSSSLNPTSSRKTNLSFQKIWRNLISAIRRPLIQYLLFFSQFRQFLRNAKINLHFSILHTHIIDHANIMLYIMHLQC